MRFTSDTPKQCEWCLSNYWLHSTNKYIHDCGAVPRSVVKEMIQPEQRIRELESENAQLKQVIGMLKSQDFHKSSNEHYPPFLRWLHAKLRRMGGEPAAHYMKHLEACAEAVEVIG